MRAPLLDTDEANLIELHGPDGQLVAFMARIFSDNTWGLCTQGDPDWPEMCVRYGFSTLTAGTPVGDIIKDGVRQHMRI